MNKKNNLSLSSDFLNKNNTDSFSKAMKTLEFDKVLDILSSFCAISCAKGRIQSICPSVSVEEIKRRLRETSDAKNLILVKSSPSFSGVNDITTHLDRASLGSVLSNAELLDIASLLRVCSSSKVYFDKVKEGNYLFTYVSKICQNRYLEEKISSSIISEDLIADNASSQLYDIRRKIRNAQNKVRDVLSKYTSGTENSKYLQENIITMRQGRYVIPVKSEYKGEVKGLIHDTSSSGSTVFIEPMAVVEANNELRTL